MKDLNRFVSLQLQSYFRMSTQDNTTQVLESTIPFTLTNRKNPGRTSPGDDLHERHMALWHDPNFFFFTSRLMGDKKYGGGENRGALVVCQQCKAEKMGWDITQDSFRGPVQRTCSQEGKVIRRLTM